MTDIADSSNKSTETRRLRLSLDGWAVTLALFLALLIGLGVIKNIPW